MLSLSSTSQEQSVFPEQLQWQFELENSELMGELTKLSKIIQHIGAEKNLLFVCNVSKIIASSLLS